MGREIRVALILTAAACLVAVLVDWVVQELNGEAQAGLEMTQAGAAVPQAAEAEQVSVEAAQEDPVSVETAQEDAGSVQDAAEESHDQAV
jgi:hypothetical protein